jgi:RNA polymerase sigma factor (sigma-70 family)
MNDEQLVEQFQNGNKEVFDELLNRYQVKVVNTCFRYLNDKEDARDAAQDIFIKLYFALPKFKPKAQFSTWLYRIAVNHSLNMLRSKKRKQWQQAMTTLGKKDLRHTNQIKSDATEDPEANLQSKEQSALVQNALAQLSTAQRTAVILHRFEGLSYKEIAAVMETSVSSVESRIFRAKQNLYKLLKVHF